MKVIGINASPRGKDSNTLKLTNAVLDGAKEEGADTEFIDLYTLRIEYCTACGTCYATGECTLLDDFSDLFDRIMNADGIVLGAPNYIDCVPAPMKALFDRMADAIHCQMLTGKFGCSVCTAGGAGETAALGKAEGDAHTLGKTLAQAIRGDITYPDQDALHKQKREYFCQLVKYNKDRFAHEYEWYEQMGWMK